ncbi:hypothetical protein BS50DRAFT_275059 [Corynespora cassiicola Philippines]|uniref:Uncharacterized protein n=1 Tax=Corynespora cassiicola Philippines TaxID=1448308 RepID=A0A2T2P0G9_CORCC|nr:hypothetical protein BS50DRAFT_275059 [Corynespora cassiicola Philippines]
MLVASPAKDPHFFRADYFRTDPCPIQGNGDQNRGGGGGPPLGVRCLRKCRRAGALGNNKPSRGLAIHPPPSRRSSVQASEAHLHASNHLVPLFDRQRRNPELRMVCVRKRESEREGGVEVGGPIDLFPMSKWNRSSFPLLPKQGLYQEAKESQTTCTDIPRRAAARRDDSEVLAGGWFGGGAKITKDAHTPNRCISRCYIEGAERRACGRGFET